ncbi:MAG: selenium-dependent xanthine dehydrogenase, partial [Cyanobacteria bacterium NC_groundwater_1444_Ag_S-0.65um_54_12]|nr:selenium-dependent xanthine dehydrogenase [Cyanobacteria bacterium NC_groundwater_1444_Ag_S-0.65um_54_12]
LNGKPVTVTAAADEKLLEILRDRCNITSPKNGCLPQGACGCCTVLVNGKATLSCVLPARAVTGKEVTTLEGLSAVERAALARGFVQAGGLQCGFCTPGIAMRTRALFAKCQNPGDAEITRALEPHLCRCTGYAKIVQGMHHAIAALRGEELPPLDTSGGVGTSLPKYEGADLVLGERNFTDDVRLAGMRHAALVFAAHPRAKVLAIDTTTALALPGVEAVITASDVPGKRYRGLVYQDWPILVACGEFTRYTGDVLAVVAARDPHTARRAAQAVKVEYEVLEPITSPQQALQAGAPALHRGGNLLATAEFKRGDVATALQRCDHVVYETFETQFIEHAYLEPECAVATLTADGTLHVFSQGQGIFDDMRQIAAILDLPEERVRVTLLSSGGAFGGKEDLTVQAYAALLAAKLRLPVKLALRRTESIRLHPKRHPIRLEYIVGCDAAGYLQAVQARLIGDKGAYASVGSKVIERAAGHATGAYHVPNVDIVALAVYTNNPPCGAMRGFGVNQANFAIESCLDMLAERCGLNGWEIRYRNVLRDGSLFTTGQRMRQASGLLRTLEAVKEHYLAARYAGIACGIKNVGIGNGVADVGRIRLVINDDETVTVFTGHTEMGQGLFTILVQIVCAETGLTPEQILVSADTIRPVDCGMTTASRATVLAGRAAISASTALRDELQSGRTLKELIGREFCGEFVYDETCGPKSQTTDPITHMTFGYATQVVILDDAGRLQKVVAAHDVGKVLNPTLLSGQIEGAIHMGLGYALTEELSITGGVPQADLRKLGILRAKDMPAIELILIEEPEPTGPYGARGVGEIGLVPTAPAVAGALHAFDGIRRTRLPMKNSPAAQFILQ